MASGSLHPCAVQPDSPLHACCPHRLDHCRWQEQPGPGHSAPPPRPGSSCAAGPARSQPGPCRAQQKSAGCATGNCPPALKHNQPQVPAQLSAAYSEDELLPHTLTRLPLLAWLPARPSPSPAVPSLRSVSSRTLGLRLPPPTLLLSTALPEAPTEGILAQSPGASFPVPVQGTVLITALHPAA